MLACEKQKHPEFIFMSEWKLEHENLSLLTTPPLLLFPSRKTTY
jgi:hypothetical protein